MFHKNGHHLKTSCTVVLRNTELSSGQNREQKRPQLQWLPAVAKLVVALC